MSSSLPTSIARNAPSGALPLIVSFSDNRWDSGLTGRQHVLSRLARNHDVIFANPLHDLRAPRGWDKPANWRGRLRRDSSGVRVLEWPAWLGQSYQQRIERPLLRARQRRLAKFIQRESPDADPILYVWHPDAWPLIENLPARLVCYHIYDHYELLSPKFATRIAARHAKLAARADRVICVSHGLAERFGGVSDRVHVVPNGADASHFAQRNLPEPSEIADLSKRRLMLIARLNGNYNYRLLHALVSDCQSPLVIVGPRRGMPAEIERDFDRLLEHPLVRWVGEQPFERLPAFVSHCDIGLIPYRAGTSSDFASPLKLFEYLAAGKGVIAANVESVRPYADQVALADSPEQWAAAVERIIAENNPARIQQRQQLARDNSWDTRVGQIESILVDALECSGNAAEGEAIHV